MEFFGGGVTGDTGLGESGYLERGVLGYLFGGDAGMEAQRAEGVSRSTEVEDTEVGDNAGDVQVLVCRVLGIDLVVADTAHHVDLVDEHSLGVLGDEVARRVVDGVARGAAHTEHLTRRLLKRAEGGEVLVAVAIELIGAHDYVATARSDDVEHLAERHPSFDGALRSDCRGVLENEGFTIGDQQVGFGGEPSQASADGGRRRHRAGHDFACTGEDFSARENNVLCAGDGGFAHFACSPAFDESANFFTAAW